MFPFDDVINTWLCTACFAIKYCYCVTHGTVSRMICYGKCHSMCISYTCRCIEWFDTVWFQVCFQLYGPVFSMSWYGYRYLWHCTLVSTPNLRIAYRTGFWVCVVLVLNVIRCSCHYFIDRILFHHDFLHDSCDYHWDFMAINYLLIYTLGFLYISSSGSASAQLPGCFRPCTFALNIGLTMFPLDSFMSCLHSLLGYSTGEFQALQLIVHAAFGAVDQPLVCWSTFGKSSSKS